MPAIHVQLDTPVARSFRVDQVAGMFDAPVADRSKLDLRAHVPPLEAPGSDWTIGAIVGPSGSGKGQIARHWLGKRFLEASPDRTTGHRWPKDKAIVDAFPADLETAAITGALNAVGFSSPPAWVLPYAALSTGQRARADLARVLLRDEPVLGVDEFTSTVDRQIGQFMAAAAAKAIRKQRCRLHRLVAVTCHYDVLDWLEPDWVLDMADRTLRVGADLKRAMPRGSLQRPENGEAPPIRAARKRDPGFRGRPAIALDVHRVSARDYWPRFAPHHYLSHTLHRAARCYVAFWSRDGQTHPTALCATLPGMGIRGMRRVSRLVVQPDFQGMGIGLRLLDAVAAIETADPAHRRMSITTSHPALISALPHRPTWRLRDVAQLGCRQTGWAKGGKYFATSFGRTTVSFEFQPAHAPG
jgi:GNAT superfamily N-acetyltransferase